MIPTLSMPNIQVAPPVEVSLFTGQNADAALGRLPVITVPPAISNAKIADNRGGQPAQRAAQNIASTQSFAAVSPLSLSGTGELVFESPYSTTFVAQLFGQFQASDSGLGALSEESLTLPLGFVDFDRLSQFDVTKYMPSFAFRPQVETPPSAEIVAPRPKLQIKNAPVQQAAAPQQVANAPAEPAEVNLQTVQPETRDAALSKPADTMAASASLMGSGGIEAYSSTQSRNQFNLNSDSRGAAVEISLIL